MRARLASLLCLAVLAGGCRGLTPEARRPTPSPAPSGPHIGVVDVDKVARIHPRWPELDALTKKLGEVDALLAAPPQLSPVEQARLQRQLQAQARKLEAEFQVELRALRQQQETRLARYGEQIQGEQRKKVAELRAQIDVELKTAVEARAAALRAELRQFEAQVIDEYRFPIANLRLKADVVGVASEEELRHLTDELDRLLKERDAKVRARAEVLEIALRDFERARIAEANVRLEQAQREADAEIRRLVDARKKELDAEGARISRARQRAFQARLNDFRRRLAGIVEGQLTAAQGRQTEGLRQRREQLLAERRALAEQRARLEDSILADVKIEVAAIAAARGFDVVLTRYLTNLAGEEITTDVVARLKR